MSLRVLKFYTKYTTLPDGSTRASDWADICAIGQAQLAVTPTPISLLQKVRPVAENSEDEAAKMAWARWNYIKPLYEAWKAGNDAPVTGTPLSAWPGLTHEQAEIIKAAGYRSVEEIAEASDTTINLVKLPGIREIQANARRFVASKDQAKVTAELAKKDEEITALKDRLDEMAEMFAAMKLEQENKPRRGRPPKGEAQPEDDAA